jgi:hypothetical protein
MNSTGSISTVDWQQLSRWTYSISTVDWQQLSRLVAAFQPWATAELPLYVVSSRSCFQEVACRQFSSKSCTSCAALRHVLLPTLAGEGEHQHQNQKGLHHES